MHVLLPIALCRKETKIVIGKGVPAEHWLLLKRRKMCYNADDVGWYVYMLYKQ